MMIFQSIKLISFLKIDCQPIVLFAIQNLCIVYAYVSQAVP